MRELSERDKALIVDGIPDANLVLFCPGLQGHGATLYDRSQSANHGTISGATWKRLPSGLPILSYDGTNDKTAFPASMNYITALTLLVWAKAYSLVDDTEFLIGKWDTNAKRVWGIFGISSADSGVAFDVSADGGATNRKHYVSAGGYFSTALAKWHQYGFIFSQNSFTPIIDGVAIAVTKSVDATVNTIYSDITVPPLIGASYVAGSLARYLRCDVALPFMTGQALSVAECLRRRNRQRHLFGV